MMLAKTSPLTSTSTPPAPTAPKEIAVAVRHAVKHFSGISAARDVSSSGKAGGGTMYLPA